MSLDEVIRCLGINFLLMGYLVCATLVHIAINSSKILKQLEKMNKDNQEGQCMVEVVRCNDCKYCGSEIRDGIKFAKCELKHNWMPQANWYCADGERK